MDNEILELPRLVLNLGAMGNRKFGHQNHIPVKADELMEGARSECVKVMAKLASIATQIHKDDQAQKFARMNNPCRFQFEMQLGWLFGRPDRWKRLERADKPAAVFKNVKPLMRVLGGLEEGGDEIVRDVIGRMTAEVEWQHQPVIVKEDGKQPPENAFVLGTIPAEWTSGEPATREQAHRRAQIEQSRAFGFRAQSQALRHHCDIILAIWDVDATPGAGGTAESVSAILNERIPVIAIRFDLQNKAHVDLLHSSEDLTRPIGEIGIGNLGETITRLLSFPDRHHDHEAEHYTAYDPRVVFHDLRERSSPKLWPAFIWQWLKYIQEKSWRKMLSLPRVMWSNIFTPAKPLPTGETGSFDYHYGRVIARAEYNSGVFGDGHRGGVLLSYFLSTLAVILAVVCGIGQHNHWNSWVIITIAFLEFLTIVVLIMLWRTSTLQDWHEAYTDTRVLAESLRHMEFLAPLGMHTPLPKMPPHLSGAKHDVRQSWAFWYYRAIIREAPISIPNEDWTNILAIRDAMIGKWIGAPRNPSNVSQASYHETNFNRQERRYHKLERRNMFLFILVFFSAGWHLIHELMHIEHETTEHALHAYVLYAVCVVGPAILAAFTGYLSQIEAVRLKQRSESMLLMLKYRYDVMNSINFGDPDAVEARWRLSAEAANTAGLMIDEAAAWALIYKNADIHAG